MVKKLIFFVFVCMMLGGCTKEKADVSCEFESIADSDMKEYVFVDYPISEWIERQSVKIKNQKLEMEEYSVSLEEYFYNENLGVVAYKFSLSGNEKLTEEQFKKLERFLADGELELINERSCRPIVNRLVWEQGQVVWYYGGLLSAVSPESQVNEMKQPDEIDAVTVNYKNRKIGEFALPEYHYEENSILFDVTGSDALLSAKMTNSGICVFWNIDKILADFQQFLENLPEGEDPESYNYALYKSMYINMKNGERYDVTDSFCDEEIREENEIAGFCACFKNVISLDQVDSLEVDGVTYSICSES